ncbi:MliC family protein [Acidovorax sp. SDU_ACID1]|uniref:MliC family protein n=1 Tax=Acidovorax sp. SDU_ACID1 TaxID=3136632 RepID=UPI003873B200
MKTLYSAFFCSFLASACSSSPPVQTDRDVAFSCANGDNISVRFSLVNETAVLTRNDGSIELQQQPSGSGFMYSNSSSTIRGKGDELTVTIGRMPPIQCKAK